MSFKEQLKNEMLPKAVEYYNSGMDINSSIVKTAQDFKLNLDQTDRLMETMNTARVIAHYEKNASDRTANCDIADKDTIRKMLYADKPQEKSAGVVSGSTWGDYSMYMESETDYRRRDKMSKVAASKTPAPEKSGYTVPQLIDKVAKHSRDLESQRRFADERVAMAHDYIATELSKLAHSLSMGYEPERRYAIFKAACIKSCPNVVKSIDSEISKQIIKDASEHFKTIRRANVIDTSSVEDECKAAVVIEADLKKVAELENLASGCAKRENEVKGLIRKVASINKMAGPGGGKNPGGKDSDDKGEKSSKKPKSDPWLGGAGKTLSAAIPKAPDSAKAIYGYLNGSALTPEKIDEAMSADKHKGTELKDYVNNMRRSTIITELYNDDPVLSEASPEEITRAYATLVQAAPEASLNKEVVRAVLRQSVNSVAVSPFDAKQWADLDTSLLKNKNLSADKKA